VPNLPKYYSIWNVWNLNVWITKFELYVKCLEFENLRTKMSELGYVNT